MPELVDLRPAAKELTRIVNNISDQQLGGTTPCDGTSVAGLLDHVAGLTMAFRDCALKTVPDGGSSAPEMHETLDPQWRKLIPQRLDELAAAWQKPEAWEGMSEAGGVTMPSEVMGVVALNEIVIHGWDIARATGQQYSCDPATEQVVFAFESESAKPEQAEMRNSIFGPIVDVAADAPMFDRTLGLAGRNPAWTP